MVLLPTWRPPRDSGALEAAAVWEAAVGLECQVFLFLISDAGWEKRNPNYFASESEITKKKKKKS